MKAEGSHWGQVPILLCLVGRLILEKVWDGDGGKENRPLYF